MMFGSDLCRVQLIGVDTLILDDLRDHLGVHHTLLTQGVHGRHDDTLGVHFEVPSQSFPGITHAETIGSECYVATWHPTSDLVLDQRHVVTDRHDRPLRFLQGLGHIRYALFSLWVQAIVAFAG